MDNFRFFDQLEEGKFLKIESDRLDETIDFIRRENIKNIYVSRCHGYKLDNINPLLGLKGIKKFQYQESGDVISIQGIEKFTELEYLRIDDEQNVDLGAFPNLRFLIIKWSKKISNFGKCDNVKELNLWNFNTKEKDFTNFPFLKKLEILNLYWGNAKSLKGLKLPETIKKIKLYRFPKLETIHQLAINVSIQFLLFENCKKIEDFDSLVGLTNLAALEIDNCGEIKNFDFINKFSNPVEVKFNSKIIIDKF